MVSGISAGTTTITYTDENGATATATFVVNDLPNITGNTTVSVGGSISFLGSGIWNVTNPWQTSNPSVGTISDNGTFTASNSGTTIITYTNNNNCSVSVVVTVTAPSNPTITGDLTICLDETAQLLGSGTPASSNPWNSSDTTVATISTTGMVSGISAGTTTITYTDENGAMATATFVVNDLPTITGNTTVSVGNTISFLGSGIWNVTNPWQTSNPSVGTISDNGTFTASNSGITVITYTNSNNCSVSVVVTVTAPTNPTITGNLTICLGETAQLLGSGTPASLNPWNSSDSTVVTISTTGMVSGISAGTADITYTDENGATETATFVVNDLPTITGDSQLCVGQNSILTGLGLPNNTTPWSSSNTFVASVDSSGVIEALSAGSTEITYTNSNGCISTMNITVLSQPVLTAINLNEPYLCAGSIDFYTVDFSENNGNGTLGNTYNWEVLEPEFEGEIIYDNVSSNNITIDWQSTPIGTYTVQVTETNSLNCSVSQSSSVNIENPPMVDFEDAFICIDENNQWINQPILETNLNTNVYSFIWYLNDLELTNTGNSLIPTETGIYKVEVTSLISNCEGVFTVELSASSPIVIDVESELDFSNNPQVIVNALGGTPPYSYSLDGIDYQSENYFSIEESGVYTVFVRDQTECNIAEQDVIIFTFPNFFTPNQDGINDLWNITMPNDTYLSEIAIFNRHGKLLYKDNNLANGWDGTLNGKILPATDYWFRIDYVDNNGENKTFKSHFTLYR